MSNSIRNFLIGIAPIVLMGLGAQVHAQATDVDCSGCVNTKDIAFQAVTTGKIEQQAVTTGKIAFRAVTKSKIASNAVSTPKIKDGAVTVAKVAPELSNAIGMFCLPDETVVGMDTSGNFVCEPTGSSSATFKTVFVSSIGIQGNLGELEGADRRCQDLADGAGLTGRYKVWLSPGGYFSPSNRFVKATVPYKLTDGTIVANDFTDLTDGTLLAPINVSEHSTVLNGALVWTRATAFGVTGGVGGCNSWTSNSNNFVGATGSADAVDSSWSEAGYASCDQTRGLYCFEQ